MIDYNKEHNNFIKEYISNPEPIYITLRTRLTTYGENKAEFPEFIPIIKYLKNAVNTPEINEWLKTNEAMTINHTLLHLDIQSIKLSNNYYYGPTLRVIFRCLDFLDIYIRERERLKGSPLNPYYHRYRYTRYFEYCIGESPELIIFPTFSNIGATDLLKIRAFPCFFVGIVTDTIFVDEYIQTPAEFFIHDINHSRRMYQENLKHYNIFKSQPGNEKLNIINYYQKMREIITTKIVPLLSDKSIELPIRQLIKIILFEICHEDALPLMPDVICGTITRPSGIEVKFPEIIIKDSNLVVEDVIEKGGSILGFVLYKLRYGFFDQPGMISNLIVKKEYRTPEKILEASFILLNYLNCNITVTKEELFSIIIDRRGLNKPQHPDIFGEKIENYENPFTGNRPTALNDIDKIKQFGGYYQKNLKYINKYNNIIS